jgi:hypothetical protein
MNHLGTVADPGITDSLGEIIKQHAAAVQKPELTEKWTVIFWTSYMHSRGVAGWQPRRRPVLPGHSVRHCLGTNARLLNMQKRSIPHGK